MVIYAVYVTVHLPCQELHVYWLLLGGGGGGYNQTNTLKLFLWLSGRALR